MSTSPIAPARSLDALAVVEVLTARALNSLGVGQQAVQTNQPSGPAPQTPAQPQPPGAVAAATLQAASQQGSSAPLFADLAAVVQSPGLPPPVVAAAQQVLALATPLDPPPSAADLKAALGQSGLLLEAHFAAGEGPASDLKAALLNLRQVLQAALEEGAAAELATPVSEESPTAQAALVAPEPLDIPPTLPPPSSTPMLAQAQTDMSQLAGYAPSQAQAAPPQTSAQARATSTPFPEGPTRGQPPAEAAVAAAGAAQTAATHRLLEDTTAALARQVLFQLASAPATQRAGDPAGAHWLFELPLMTSQGTAVAQFEIDRDGEDGSGAHSADGDAQPAWRARFSLDLGDMGPVHAQVSLGGGRAAVSLWAEKPGTAQALRAGRDELADDFEADAVDAKVAVFLGQPQAPPPPRAGRILDQAL